MIKNRRIRQRSRSIGLLSILLCIFVSFVLLNSDREHILSMENNENNLENVIQNNLLKTSSLSLNNIFSGIGEPWNATHYANRTDYNLPVNFGNGTYDTAEIPLGIDWIGYQLNASIDNLYDTRNWNNGTFDFGDDDGTYAAAEDDTSDIINPYQNWTFNLLDGATNNDMSGNYLDSGYGPSDGHNCLELRMDGNPNVLVGYRNYNENDRCWWNSTFVIPRGTIISSTLEFDVNPNYLANFNSWDFGILINSQQIYSIGTYSLKQLGEGSWHSFSIPSSVWINQSNVFNSPVNGTSISIEFSLEYVATSASYSNGFTNIEYQQIFVDNIKLVSKAEVKPSQLLLKINNTDVNDVDWGKGYLELKGNWQSSKVYANFSSDDTWSLSNFDIELDTDLSLYALKNIPETSYETNIFSEGVKFSVENNSLVSWESYSYFAVPTGYEESTMRLEFPTDIDIKWVSEPQQPSVNRLTQCDNSTTGLLLIPVNSISTTPDGFWRFEGKSPNYCEELQIFKNTTSIPTGNDWIQETEFFSGDYINITTKITDSSLVSSYIQQTKAKLQIRFPNGSIWTEVYQLQSPDSNGNVDFNYFQIPKTPPNYEVGEYEAIITWNNSYSIFGLNETGIITKKFTVKHFSTLTPDQSYYANILEGDTINLLASFTDKENGDAIEDALVYIDNFLGGREYFNEISPGFYVLLDFNTSGGVAGDNILTIYANSSLYQNNTNQITINLVLKTTLTAQEFPYLQVSWNENFTIHLNYTETTTGNGIITSPTSNWLGEYSINMTSPGIYNMEFNSSLYEVNKIHSLIINVNEANYESQNVLIKIEIIERETYIDNVFLNGIEKVTDKSITLTSGQLLNITISYKDQISGDFLSGATVRVVGGGLSEFLNESLIYPQYELVFNTSLLDVGATFLTVSAQLQNYSSSAIVLTLYLDVRGTSMVVLLNGAIYPNNYITVEVTEKINITVIYTDFISGSYLYNATIELLGYGFFDENPSLEQYNYTIDAGILGQGIDILNIIATKSNYQSQPAQVTVEITEKNTNLQLFFNGDNKTADPFLELPIGSSLNITVKYSDLLGNFIDSADVILLGEGLSDSLNQSISFEQYSILLDTRQLDIGVRLLTIVAQRNNYQLKKINIRLDILRIRTNITTLSGINVINIIAGQSVDLKIKLNDLDFGGLILNATVSYRWQNGQGILTDNDNDGIYEATIPNIPKGSFIITITAFAGDDYDFERFEIFITAITEPGEDSLLWLGLFIGVSIAAGILISYLVVYTRILRFPKPVRRVRKFRKSLKRKTVPSISVTGRQKAFDSLYSEELAKTSGIIKFKPLVSKKKSIQEKEAQIPVSIKEKPETLD
ncbi:MAG: hypothetical protein ACFE9Q_06960 [Candidatus Hodarchaeota archaeon]